VGGDFGRICGSETGLPSAGAEVQKSKDMWTKGTVYLGNTSHLQYRSSAGAWCVL
jgi:hypothetical protein